MTDDTQHSEWGGSIAYRVKNCPGCVALCRSVPKRPSSEAADHGTWAHALAGYCLEQGYRSANSFVHTSLPLGVAVPPQYSARVCGQELVDGVNVYLDAVFAELDLTEDAELYIEDDFELSIGRPGQVYGRCDALIWHPSLRRVRGFDFKNGAQLVDAEDNDQAQFYISGALEKHGDWDPLEAIVTIVQPNPWQVGAGTVEAVKDWQVQTVDLSLWLDSYETAVALTEQGCDEFEVTGGFSPEAGPVAGPWCEKTFCDAMAVCPAQEARAMDASTLGFKDVLLVSTDVLPDPKSLDMDRLERIVQATALLSTWARKCEEYLEGLVLNGHPAKLWKPVDKIGRRKYVVGDGDVVDFLDMAFGIPADVATRTNLQTITEMKKIMKQHGASVEQINDFEMRYTVKESSGLTMAPISDKRPAVPIVATSYAGVSVPTA